MKASELRIGNFVKHDKGNYYINFFLGLTFVDLEVVGFEYTDDNHECDIQELEPIPLTEEWLVKFGFRDTDKGSIYSKYQVLSNDINDTFDAVINIKVHRNLFNRSKILSFEYKFTVIKYVHQLQNLYHALTGEELTIKK